MRDLGGYRTGSRSRVSIYSAASLVQHDACVRMGLVHKTALKTASTDAGLEHRREGLAEASYVLCELMVRVLQGS